jgi:hypothetical protein
MGETRRLPLWKRDYTISPTMATLLGVALGCLLSILCAATPSSDFSYSFLARISLFLVPLGGTFGYILWLCSDRSRQDRLARIWSRVAGVMVLCLLVAFPSVWWHVGRSMGPHLVLILMGAVCGMAMFAVGAGWGIVHLIGYTASLFLKTNKYCAYFRTDGVWDSELDRH